MHSRWEIWKNESIENAGGLCYCLRLVVNQDESRQRMVNDLLRADMGLSEAEWKKEMDSIPNDGQKKEES